MPRAFWIWFYSTGNLLGSALALIGLGLYFTGLIDRWWWLIVPGLYLSGLLLAPPRSPAMPPPTPGSRKTCTSRWTT